jgi:hypothetical protein
MQFTSKIVLSELVFFCNPGGIMNEADYTSRHAHAQEPAVVEIVAYERKDGSWDVFVFKPRAAFRNLKTVVQTPTIYFIERILSPDEIDAVARKVDLQLGPGYKQVPFYREKGTRRIIDRLTSHLYHTNARNYYVSSCRESEWELHIRRKDFDLAEKVMAPNVAESSTSPELNAR